MTGPKYRPKELGQMKRFALVLGLLICTLFCISSVAGASTITLTGTVRDFLANGTPAGTYNGHLGVGHIDFENICCPNDHHIVTSTLGGDGKPVYDGVGSTSTHSAAAFNQWFNDTPGVN